MAARCEELGVVLKLSSKVVSVNFDKAEVTIEGGEVVKSDVVLCTDGLWSTMRSQFLGKPSPAILTGDLAYRIVIQTADLKGPNAPELKKFIEDEMVNFWVGPGTHVVAYTMRAGSVYNIVLLCPDNLPPSVTKTEGDLNEMKSLFQGWDPILRKFLDQVRGVAKWNLNGRTRGGRF
jgi:salicylate hydroxylase